MKYWAGFRCDSISATFTSFTPKNLIYDFDSINLLQIVTILTKWPKITADTYYNDYVDLLIFPMIMLIPALRDMYARYIECESAWLAGYLGCNHVA